MYVGTDGMNHSTGGLSTTVYENTRGICGVLKVFYSIRFFNRLQGGSSDPFVLDLTGSDPSIITHYSLMSTRTIRSHLS